MVNRKSPLSTHPLHWLAGCTALFASTLPVTRPSLTVYGFAIVGACMLWFGERRTDWRWLSFFILTLVNVLAVRRLFPDDAGSWWVLIQLLSLQIGLAAIMLLLLRHRHPKPSPNSTTT